jgi:hypothetical protein
MAAVTILPRHETVSGNRGRRGHVGCRRRRNVGSDPGRRTGMHPTLVVLQRPPARRQGLRRLGGIQRRGALWSSGPEGGSSRVEPRGTGEHERHRRLRLDYGFPYALRSRLYDGSARTSEADQGAAGAGASQERMARRVPIRLPPVRAVRRRRTRRSGRTAADRSNATDGGVDRGGGDWPRGRLDPRIKTLRRALSAASRISSEYNSAPCTTWPFPTRARWRRRVAFLTTCAPPGNPPAPEWSPSGTSRFRTGAPGTA